MVQELINLELYSTVFMEFLITENNDTHLSVSKYYKSKEAMLLNSFYSVPRYIHQLKLISKIYYEINQVIFFKQVSKWKPTTDFTASRMRILVSSGRFGHPKEGRMSQN